MTESLFFLPDSLARCQNRRRRFLAHRALSVEKTDSATLAAMIFRMPVSWTRRRVLKTIPTVLASALVPASWRAIATLGTGPAKPQLPFSRFVDVAASAGLTQTMFYGDSAGATYVTEIMGGGCAFFDYDNDGWMDIFILGGRTPGELLPAASNRLYKNNRDGTFTDVTDKVRPVRSQAGPSASALATTTTMASKISSSPTTARIASTETTATEPLPM